MKACCWMIVFRLVCFGFHLFVLYSPCNDRLAGVNSFSLLQWCIAFIVCSNNFRIMKYNVSSCIIYDHDSQYSVLSMKLCYLICYVMALLFFLMFSLITRVAGKLVIQNWQWLDQHPLEMWENLLFSRVLPCLACLSMNSSWDNSELSALSF